MEADLWVFLQPAVALLMGVEIVIDDVQFVVRKGGNDRFMKPRNSRRATAWNAPRLQLLEATTCYAGIATL